ncbi:MAG: hypothetical protein PHQ42_05130 [Patescibacteria group bacterium]|nr:hypothetical protein [Patescibacteria group bacterium]
MSKERAKQCLWTVVAFAVAMVAAYHIFGNTTMPQTYRLVASGGVGLVFGLMAGVVNAP